MRRLVIAILVTALTAAVAATAAPALTVVGPRTAVSVTPRSGIPTTTFTVRFRTPVATDSRPGLRAWEVASVVDRGQSGRSCTSDLAVRLAPAGVHARVSVRLSAPTTSWCAGAYAGTITLYRAFVCGPGPIPARMVCPQIAFAPEPIGRFRFKVTAVAS